MLSERVFYGKDDPEWGQDTKYVYWCAPCVAMKRSIPLTEAMLLISESGIRHKATRAARFKEARESKRSEIEGMTHEGIRKLVLDDLVELFYPLADLILKKIDQLTALQDHQEKIQELRSRLKESRSVEKAKQIEE